MKVDDISDVGQNIIDDGIVKTEIIRSRHGDTIIVKTKFNAKFNRSIEHIEIVGASILLPTVPPPRLGREYLVSSREPFDFSGVLKS